MTHRGLIQALVVDDEALSRQFIVELVTQDPRFQVVAACASGCDAVTTAATTKLDVAFLDVRMPRMDGFQTLQELEKHVSLFVFVTAYSEYATRAFDVNAVDYVTKPIDPERFSQTLDRVYSRLNRRNDILGASSIDAAANELIDPARLGQAGSHLLSAVRQDLVYRESEIELVESHRNYVKVLIRGEFTLVRESLESFCRRLTSADFVRVHRSYVVNMKWVRQLRYRNAGTAEIVLADGHIVPVSRRSRGKVAELMRSIDT